jgi:hypothetical protein
MAARCDVRLSAEEVRLLLRSLDHYLVTCAKKAARGRQTPCEHCDRTQILRRRLARIARSSDGQFTARAGSDHAFPRGSGHVERGGISPEGLDFVASTSGRRSRSARPLTRGRA